MATRPVVHVTIQDDAGVSVHTETRSAFNAGIRASEAAILKIARAEGTTYEAERPVRVDDTYTRRWVSRNGKALIVTVTKESHGLSETRGRKRGAAAGAAYAAEQVGGDYFRDWTYDQLVEASRMDPSKVLPLETKADATVVAKNMLQQLAWDTKRDLDDVAGLSGGDVDGFWRGFEGHLRDPKVRGWLADELLEMNQQVQAPSGRLVELTEKQKRPRGAAQYRITVKSWDRHYGDGHVVFKNNFEAKPTDEVDARAVEILEKAMRANKPQGRNAEAWAERISRGGFPVTLIAYSGSGGAWVVKTRRYGTSAEARAPRPKAGRSARQARQPA